MNGKTGISPAAVVPAPSAHSRRDDARLRAVPATDPGASRSGGASAAGDTKGDDRARFAANLRRRRSDAGLSQEALAAAARLHRTEISLLERSERDPRLTTIVRLARALRIRPADLLDGID